MDSKQSLKECLSNVCSGFHPQYHKIDKTLGDTGKGRINICHLILEFVDRSLIKLKVTWEKESNAVRLKDLMRKTAWWWQPWDAVLRRPGCMPVVTTLTTRDQTQILTSHCEEVNGAFFWWSTSRPLAAGPLTFGEVLRMPWIWKDVPHPSGLRSTGTIRVPSLQAVRNKTVSRHFRVP